MNHIVLIGRLTKDPDLRYTSAGSAVCNFTLAVNRTFAKENQQQADFISIQAWGKRAETCAQYLKKGKLAGVEGRLQIRSYDDNEGQRHWITEVVADNVEFLSPADKDSKQNAENLDRLGEEIEFDDNDIPF